MPESIYQTSFYCVIRVRAECLRTPDLIHIYKHTNYLGPSNGPVTSIPGQRVTK